MNGEEDPICLLILSYQQKCLLCPLCLPCLQQIGSSWLAWRAILALSTTAFLILTLRLDHVLGGRSFCFRFL
jgi:hypothetical protein